MDNADHRIKKKNLSPRVITIYAKWTAIQLNRIHFLIPPKIFIWKQKTLRVQTLVQLHISNAFKRCFLSRKENNFHDFHMTVWEQFYTQSDLSHKALHMPVGISSFPYFLCIVLYTWQTSNQMKKNSLWPSFQADR